ncbi:MAG: hypothetical protein ACRYFS_23405 [Janthinobacterium lividum]
MNLYLKATAIGVVAGMRSMSAPAFTSDYFVRQPSLFLDASPLKWIGLPLTAKILKVMALGELVGDKLPNTPNRTAPLPLVGRAVTGGLCGAAVFRAEGEKSELGALVGAVSAVASTFLFFQLRHNLGKSGKIPDYVTAAAEDALVLGIGRSVFPKTA